MTTVLERIILGPGVSTGLYKYHGESDVCISCKTFMTSREFSMNSDKMVKLADDVLTSANAKAYFSAVSNFWRNGNKISDPGYVGGEFVSIWAIDAVKYIEKRLDEQQQFTTLEKGMLRILVEDIPTFATSRVILPKLQLLPERDPEVHKGEPTEPVSSPKTCAHCKKEFSSRSKLFEHLKLFK